MAAADELPRGWVAHSGPATGGQVAITIPASPGVSHVLTAINALIYQFAAHSGQGAGVNVQLGSGTTQFYLPGLTFLPLPGVDPYESASGSWTGSLTAPIGAAITVEFDSAPAGAYEALELQGYDY